GEATFTAPPGWTVAKSSGSSVTLHHTDERGGRAIILVGADPLRGNVADALRQLVSGSFPDFDLKLGTLREHRSVYGFPASSFDETARSRKLNLRARFSGVGFAVNQKLQIAWLMTPDDARAYDRMRELQQLADTLRFPNAQGQNVWDPVNPPRGSGGL